MTEISDFTQLDVWQKGRDLVQIIYGITLRFPGAERNALATQMQRAAISVPSSIAEGYGRGTRQEYMHSLRLARGSLCELESQLILAHDLGLVADPEPVSVVIRDTHRLLHGLLRALHRPPGDGKEVSQ